MKTLQIAACIFFIWLVLGRQETRVRILARPPGMSFECCLCSVYDSSLPTTEEALKPVIQRSDVYVENIEGTSIYILSAPYWTTQQARQARKELQKTTTDFLEAPDVKIRLIDDVYVPDQPFRWQLLVATLGLVLIVFARTVKRP